MFEYVFGGSLTGSLHVVGMGAGDSIMQLKAVVCVCCCIEGSAEISHGV